MMRASMMSKAPWSRIKGLNLQKLWSNLQIAMENRPFLGGNIIKISLELFFHATHSKNPTEDKPITPGLPAAPCFFWVAISQLRDRFPSAPSAQRNRLYWVPKRGAKALTRQALYHFHIRTHPNFNPLWQELPLNTDHVSQLMSAWNHLQNVQQAPALSLSLSLSLFS